MEPCCCFGNVLIPDSFLTFPSNGNGHFPRRINHTFNYCPLPGCFVDSFPDIICHVLFNGIINKPSALIGFFFRTRTDFPNRNCIIRHRLIYDINFHTVYFLYLGSARMYVSTPCIFFTRAMPSPGPGGEAEKISETAVKSNTGKQ